MNSNVLVTGAPGWVGTPVVRLLAAGMHGPGAQPWRSIRCLVKPGVELGDLSLLASSLSVVRGDLRAPDDVERFVEGASGGTILHLAGVIHPHIRRRELYDVNALGTRHLVEAALRAGARRIVYLSSNSPLGCNPDPIVPLDERSPYRPYLHYGRSKMLGELEVERAKRSRRIETVIVRAPWFYGEGQPARQSEFFARIRRGSFPLVGSGENLRSMAYVGDLAEGLLRAAQLPQAAGEIYWLADARPYSMNEIVDTIERLLEHDFGLPVAHRRLRLPAFTSKLAYAADLVLQSAGFYHPKIHVASELGRSIFCSVDKARKELEYDPRVGLEEGMRRSIRWAIANGVAL